MRNFFKKKSKKKNIKKNKINFIFIKSKLLKKKLY
jgi:hypothetical protein